MYNAARLRKRLKTMGKAVKLYFDEYGEICRTLDNWRDILGKHPDYLGVREIELFEAKRAAPNDQFFFCRHYGMTGEKGQCGRMCENYNPRNGKNGCCIHVGFLYEATDKTVTIKAYNQQLNDDAKTNDQKDKHA